MDVCEWIVSLDAAVRYVGPGAATPSLVDRHLNECPDLGSAQRQLSAGFGVLVSAALSYTANRAAILVEEGYRSCAGGLDTKHRWPIVITILDGIQAKRVVLHR